MSITLKQAKELKYGDILHSEYLRNHDNTCQRWEVNGVVKVWKTRPLEVKVPIRRGPYAYGYLTHSRLYTVHLDKECQNV